MKEINLKFEGYCRYGTFPDDWFEKSGIYCVYAGKTTLRQLLYIGESNNVFDRLSNHEKLEEWKKYLQKGEMLWISVTFINSEDRERAEAACIFEHKPPCNTEYTENFPYKKTQIIICGDKALLKEKFIVGCTE